jgi:glycosyltransferase involved in cell wall biosynthesis
MRVLVAASTFPLHPDDGGPRFVLDLCQALLRHVDVTVVAPAAPGAAARERWGDLEIRRFAYFLPRSRQCLAYGAGMSENLSRSWLARLQVPGFLAAEARALRALARELRCDVVHSHWILPQGLTAAWARGRERRFAHVTTLHGSDSYFLPRLPACRALAEWICARSDAVLAVATNVRENLDRVLGRPSGACLLPMGVDTAHFRSPAASRAEEAPFPGGFLLFVGRFVAQKGLDVLLRALPRVREQHPGLGLVALGDGPLAPELRRTARELGLDPWVRFAGRVDRARVAAHLQACRVAVVPSVVDRGGRAEGLPSAALEALAAGARLVATDAGGVPDRVVHGRNGWLALAGDPADLAAKLLLALDAPLPPGVAESADALDWARVAERHVAVYERALRGAQR